MGIIPDSMIERAAIRLYEARLARDKAKEAFIKYREAFGACEILDGPHAEACYSGYRINTGHEWCDVCKKGQPLYFARKAACKEAGVAMRALMYLCKKQGNAFSDMA